MKSPPKSPKRNENVQAGFMSRIMDLVRQSYGIEKKDQRLPWKGASSELKIDQRVVTFAGDAPIRGVVRYIGEEKQPDGHVHTIVGLELDKRCGSGTGKYKGKQLFIAPRDYAIVVDIETVIPEKDFDGNAEEVSTSQNDGHVGPSGAKKFQKIMDQQEQKEVKEEQLEQKELTDMQQQELERASLHEQLRDKEVSVIRMEQQLRMKDGQQQNLERQLRELEQQLTNCHGQLRQKNEQLREKDQKLTEKDEQLRRKDEQLTEKDEQMQGKGKQLREKDEEQENLQKQFREMEQHEENLQRQLTEIGRQLTVVEEQSREREDERASLQQQNAILERQLRDKEEEVNELEISLSTIQQTISEQNRQGTSDWVIARDEIQISEKCLGRGGWGSVYEGMYCGCAIAVKQIHELILSAHNRRLFEREMNIASKCRHPCLLQFIGATNDEGSPLFVTELMETSLRELLQQQQLSVTEIAVISLDVAKALNYLHEKKPEPIIHRDVSSANVLLWRQGDQWRGKVSDYGTANFMQHTMTKAPGAMIYSAPEALTSNQTVKVDVYSFGVLLYEMCIRELPDPRRRDEQVALVTNRALRGLVRRCLQTDPERRPSMLEIIDSLRQFNVKG